MLKLEFSPNSLPKTPHHLCFQVYLLILTMDLNDGPLLTFLTPLLSLCLIPHHSPWPDHRLDTSHAPTLTFPIPAVCPLAGIVSADTHLAHSLTASSLRSDLPAHRSLPWEPTHLSTAACCDTSPSLPHGLSPHTATFFFFIALSPSAYLLCLLLSFSPS